MKGDVQSLAAGRNLAFEAATHPACHPGRCAAVSLDGQAIGMLGELHPRLQQKYELPAAPVRLRARSASPSWRAVSRVSGVFPACPSVRRDYAFTVAEEVPVGHLLAALRGRVPAFVRAVEVFDQYRGKGVEPGKKSLALRIVMQDTDRTLTDSEVEGAVSSVRRQLNQEFQARPRT